MRRSKSILIVLALALAVLLVAGGAVSAAPTGDATVTVNNFSYNPSPVTIQAGDTVTWENVEGFHNVVADPGQAETFGNAPAPAPWTYSHTFTIPGTYEYYCEIHSTPTGTFMNGVVVVEAPPTAVTLGALDASQNSAVALWALGAGLLGLGALAGLRRARPV